MKPNGFTTATNRRMRTRCGCRHRPALGCIATTATSAALSISATGGRIDFWTQDSDDDAGTVRPPKCASWRQSGEVLLVRRHGAARRQTMDAPSFMVTLVGLHATTAARKPPNDNEDCCRRAGVVAAEANALLHGPPCCVCKGTGEERSHRPEGRGTIKVVGLALVVAEVAEIGLRIAVAERFFDVNYEGTQHNSPAFRKTRPKR